MSQSVIFIVNLHNSVSDNETQFTEIIILVSMHSQSNLTVTVAFGELLQCVVI